MLSASSPLDLKAYLPPQFWHHRSGSFLTAPAAGTGLDLARTYLNTQAASLGLTATDLRDALVTRDFVSDLTNTTHLTFQQTVHGLPVFNANITVNVSARGEIINAGGGFVAGAAQQTPRPAPVLSAVQALGSAAGQLGLYLTGPLTVSPAAADLTRTTTVLAPGVSLDPVTARLEYVAAPGGVALAWNMALRVPGGEHWYNVHVNTATGQIASLVDWVSSFAERGAVSPVPGAGYGPGNGGAPGVLGGAAYNVYPRPVEAPSFGDRTILVDPHDPMASPFGWHDTNGAAGAEFTDTRGNNVNAQGTGSFRPSGGANLQFDFPINLAQAPSTYRPASITNLYYWNNVLHDTHYRYGFTPAARNFQVNNYGQGGAGNDPVQADSAPGCTNNAFFSTPPDGSSGRMQSCIWTSPNPDRITDLDAFVIAHEYGHGVSNRLTGNANGLNATQSGGMGEGWSDWWGLMFTQTWAFEQLFPRGAGTYVLGQPPTGPGIRAYPYAWDMTTNPLTLGRYNQNQAVHFAGTIWATTLWDLNFLLTALYGYNPDISGGYTGSGDAGNILALRLVMDGLKLQPLQPSFLQARDAILQADMALTGGANQVWIWSVFARRGYGHGATDGGSQSRSVVENFSIPPEMRPAVFASEPSEGQVVQAPFTTLRVYFNWPVDPGSVSASDLGVTDGIVQSAQVIDEYTVEFTVSGVNPGLFGAYLLEGALTDYFGHPSHEFSVTFEVVSPFGPGGLGGQGLVEGLASPASGARGPVAAPAVVSLAAVPTQRGTIEAETQPAVAESTATGELDLVTRATTLEERDTLFAELTW